MTAIEQAKAYALQKTGLKWENLAKWTDAQRSAYLAANAEFRQKNPTLFSQAELNAAANYGTAATVRDAEFSYVSEFGRELGNRVQEIGGQVAGVGEGIFSGLSLLRWLIPVGVVAVVGIWLWRFAGSPSLSRSTRK